jgi:hypothetical protein
MSAARCLGRRGSVPQERAEHGLVVIPVVPLPDPLVQVAGKPACRDRVVGSAHVGLEVAEEALNRVRVYVAIDVDALRVLDATELVDASTTAPCSTTPATPSTTPPSKAGANKESSATAHSRSRSPMTPSTRSSATKSSNTSNTQPHSLPSSTA